VSRSDSGQRFVIHFDGVFRDSKVWFNGLYCCSNASGYSGFSCDVTDYVRYGRENVLVVRVDASQYEGWYYEGAGIYRHVWFNEYNNLHIAEDGMFVHSTVRGAGLREMGREMAKGPAISGEVRRDTVAEVTVETTISNDNSAEGVGEVSAYLTDREGKLVGHSEAESVDLQPGESWTVRQTIELAHPLLWSPETPYLYRAGAVIRSGGAIVDEEKIRIGVRTIDIDQTGLYVNGQYT
jgi:beta-galactosidase